ncbi:hypothetical protein Acsp04_61610 [Actinomadura sp. NBRC 104425]|nr:hypothetical protein [Actinomadura sp. NBRC 104425]GLZ15926.1 hypothetical protein Acsp04_61610 [Actinomadura sp. NBRC 104425]
MTVLMPFHAGLVVADLQQAVEHLANTFGYTFHPPTRLGMPRSRTG